MGVLIKDTTTIERIRIALMPQDVAMKFMIWAGYYNGLELQEGNSFSRFTRNGHPLYAQADAERLDRLQDVLFKCFDCVSVSRSMASLKKAKERVHITCEDGHKMAILIYRPDGRASDATTGVLWIHGGGYITGMASMAGMMGMGPILVKKHGCVVVSPEYRLGKNGQYPNALNDCYAALKYMVSHSKELGIRSDQIFVGGESAGGGLCAALCMLARDKGEINLAFQMPLYPMIDDRDTESSRDNHNKVWNTRLNRFGWKTYLGELYGTDNVPAYAAPARQTDYSNLPPAYTFVCTDEPFYCETLSFVENLRKAGIETGCDVYKGLYHAFDMLSPGKEVSKEAISKFEDAFRYAQQHYFKPNND